MSFLNALKKRLSPLVTLFIVMSHGEKPEKPIYRNQNHDDSEPPLEWT